MGKRYDHDFQEYVAKLVVEDGRVARQVADELEIAKSTVGRWVAHYRDKLNRADDSHYKTQKELIRLQKEQEKEIKRLKEENDILKKAMHIFTHDPT